MGSRSESHFFFIVSAFLFLLKNRFFSLPINLLLTSLSRDRTGRISVLGISRTNRAQSISSRPRADQIRPVRPAPLVNKMCLLFSSFRKPTSSVREVLAPADQQSNSDCGTSAENPSMLDCTKKRKTLFNSRENSLMVPISDVQVCYIKRSEVMAFFKGALRLF